MPDSVHLDGPSLQKFLDDTEPHRGAAVVSFRPISGGYSRLTAMATVKWADGSEEALVLRADPPPGSGIFHSDRDAEWHLLQALYGRAPVRTAKPRYYEPTGEHFGAKCLAVEFFGGRPLPELAKSPGGLDRAREIFVDTAVKIHSTPLDLLPADMQRPPDWSTYIDGLVEYLRTIDESVSDSNPALHYAAAQLKEHRPPPVPLTLVHGDFQPANLLVPDSGDDPLVIDWEFARIGDPREDLGYYSGLQLPPNLYQTDPEAFLARYRERMGLSEEQINQDTVAYFFLLGMARLLGQLIHAADDLYQGNPRGVMATYLFNAISDAMHRFFDIARRLAS